MKPKLLLHSCCGPCSTSVIERLTVDYDITLFFYNPNITDKDEYKRRRDVQIRFLELYNEKEGLGNPISFLEGSYVPDEFYNIAKGLEKEAEGGKRCEMCFELRLKATAESARNMGFDHFGTTLSVSPRKNHALICHIGKRLASNLQFLDDDFKKKDGFYRSVQLSKEYKLYRQNYCGCEFSK